MTDALDHSALDRWRAEPLDFITEVLRNPETGRPFALLPAQRRFFAHAWQFSPEGRFLHPEQVFGCPKKSGKTATAAMHVLVTTLVYGGPYAEAYAVANDLEQAQGRVFEAIRRIVEASPFLRQEAEITAKSIRFPATGASITALASDYAGAAGANPTISSFDELWGYTSESARRLWDEMVPVPTRKVSCRLVTSYAGFEGESELLHELHKRGTSQNPGPKRSVTSHTSHTKTPCLSAQGGELLQLWITLNVIIQCPRETTQSHPRSHPKRP
jgi:hypothetical protein